MIFPGRGATFRVGVLLTKPFSAFASNPRAWRETCAKSSPSGYPLAINNGRINMYIYIYLYTHVCVYIYIYTYLYVYIYYIHMCIWTYLDVYVPVTLWQLDLNLWTIIGKSWEDPRKTMRVLDLLQSNAAHFELSLVNLKYFALIDLGVFYSLVLNSTL